jgi:hypothetical protein
MATRKKKTVTRTTLERLEREIPASLREYSQQVQRLLARLESNIDKVTAAARREATKLLREASYRLGELETRGESAWGRLTDQYRRDAVQLLRRLEKAVAPPSRSRKKAATKATRTKPVQ